MLICIGGVCVPYSAVVPIILLALKWVVVKLARMGLLPKAIGDALQVGSATSDAGQESIIANGPSVVKTLESEDVFRELIKDGKETIVCKFTASWCKPCHKVQPFYDTLSSHYACEAKFLTIDVDAFDEIASQYSVSMMPTFLVLQGEKILGSYSGSNELELQRFLKEQLGRSD